MALGRDHRSRYGSPHQAIKGSQRYEGRDLQSTLAFLSVYNFPFVNLTAINKNMFPDTRRRVFVGISINHRVFDS
jgi:methyl coenzyme M reductase alpha subunit